MLDVHCHILPGVDDGARNLQESISMLKAAQAAGITHIACTSHCRGSKFHYPTWVQAFQQLQPYAQRMGLELAQGFEVYWQNLLNFTADQFPHLCIQGTNLMLLEFSWAALPVNWQGMVNMLLEQGIQPIIAHPERYAPVQKDVRVAEQLVDAGCLLQLSGNFVEGGMMDARKRTAQKLLKAGLITYVASDAHCAEDYPTFTKALAFALKHKGDR